MKSSEPESVSCVKSLQMCESPIRFLHHKPGWPLVLLIGRMVEEYNVQKSKIIFWILSFFKIPTVSSSIFKPRIVYQMHRSLTVLHSTFVVPLLNRNLWCWICWSHSPSLGVTALSALITMGTTIAFTLHTFLNSSLIPWYFLSFSCCSYLKLLSLSTTTAITKANILCLSTSRVLYYNILQTEHHKGIFLGGGVKKASSSNSYNLRVK